MRKAESFPEDFLQPFLNFLASASTFSPGHGIEAEIVSIPILKTVGGNSGSGKGFPPIVVLIGGIYLSIYT